jgi:2-phosphoglycerate kinase
MMNTHKTPIVVDRDYRFPYSRGIMTQSLLSVGLGVTESYDAANEILRQLEARGAAEINKKQLKKLASEVLSRGFGEQYAKRYADRRSATPQILVMQKNTGLPFSKGLLSQSLQASGMDPSASHELAQEIEGNLLRSGRNRITREDLRRITAEALRTKYDEAFAERYLLWRDLKAPPKPLFILIGGGTGTGKSTIATQLGYRLGITHVLSTDTIRQMMRTMFSSQLMPSLHSSSYDAWKQFDTPLPEDTDPVLAAFREQLLRVSVGIQAMLDRALEEHVSMIVDGVHVVPGFIKKGYFRAAYTALLIVTTEDEAAHRNRFRTRSEEARDRRAQKYVDNFQSIRKIQDFIVGCARQQNVPIFDNVHLDNTVLSIIHFLTDFIKAANAPERSREHA